VRGWHNRNTPHFDVVSVIGVLVWLVVFLCHRYPAFASAIAESCWVHLVSGVRGCQTKQPVVGCTVSPPITRELRLSQAAWHQVLGA
jgi:hypothetical protein